MHLSRTKVYFCGIALCKPPGIAWLWNKKRRARNMIEEAYAAFRKGLPKLKA
jgi:hypothetical protein